MDSNLPHCSICCKPVWSGSRCKEHSDLEKFPLYDPNSFTLGEAIQFFADSCMKVIGIDEKGIFEIKGK